MMIMMMMMMIFIAVRISFGDDDDDDFKVETLSSATQVLVGQSQARKWENRARSHLRGPPPYKINIISVTKDGEDDDDDHDDDDHYRMDILLPEKTPKVGHCVFLLIFLIIIIVSSASLYFHYDIHHNQNHIHQHHSFTFGCWLMMNSVNERNPGIQLALM